MTINTQLEELEELTDLIINSLEDIKAKDIKIIDATANTSLFNKLIIVTGDSNRHVKAIIKNTENNLKEFNYNIIGCEGMENGEWVLLDIGDIVVHAMLPQIREFYDLESMWINNNLSNLITIS